MKIIFIQIFALNVEMRGDVEIFTSTSVSIFDFKFNKNFTSKSSFYYINDKGSFVFWRADYKYHCLKPTISFYRLIIDEMKKIWSMTQFADTQHRFVNVEMDQFPLSSYVYYRNGIALCTLVQSDRSKHSIPGTCQLIHISPPNVIKASRLVESCKVKLIHI
jgi:hypothetical protein